MTFTPERATVNQRVQIGAESTSALGTSVAATKLLQALTFDDAIEADVAEYRGTGRKYPATLEENREWASMDVGGNLDYNALCYILAGTMGAASPVAHGASSTAKDWVFTPPITGSIVPQTYTIEHGDTTRAHKFTYGLFTDFGYKGTRKDFTLNGTKMMMQPIQDNITMTASPTAVPIVPMPSKHFNVYLDATSGGLGTTQLLRVLSIEYAMPTVYSDFWALNRATVGFSGHVDQPPKAAFKLLVEADAQGMALLAYLQSSVTYYLRVQAQGSTAIASDGPGNIFNTFTHDMAVKFSKPDKFQDDQGIFAIQWNMTIVEDTSWTGPAAAGTAQTMTVTNLLTAL
jgi:hypothetical protein